MSSYRGKLWLSPHPAGLLHSECTLESLAKRNLERSDWGVSPEGCAFSKVQYCREVSEGKNGREKETNQKPCH